MQKNVNIISRRAFLDRSMKLGIAAGLSSLVDIPFVMKRALAEGNIGLNNKKVLFIWLRGANDALNSVIPIMDSAYATSRDSAAAGGIRIEKDPGGDSVYTTPGAAFDATQFRSIGTPRVANDGTYAYDRGIALGNGFAALHPALKFLAPVYNAGDLALVHRVAYPRQSRSHFDSQRYWENGSPNKNLVNDGIFYRTIYESGLANTAPLTGVTIQSSLPLIMRGSEAAMTNLTDPERYELLGIPNDVPGINKAFGYVNAGNTYQFPDKKNRELLKLQYGNLSTTLSLFQTIDFSEAGNTFRDDVITDNDDAWAAANGGQGYFLFPTTNDKNGGWRRNATTVRGDKYVVPPNLQGFFNQLKAAALVLNKTDTIIAGTEFGGFDTHQGQGAATGVHADLNKGIGWAIYALKKYFTRYADKASWNNVVIVTLSEFGRTTIENSDSGTDHAEAGVMWVAGDGVRGYNKAGSPTGVFNCSPTTDPVVWTPGNSGAMFGVSGRYLSRTTDYRSVLGEIIRKHLGGTQSQLNRIIPGYADTGERLLAGGISSVDGVRIRGEVGFL